MNKDVFGVKLVYKYVVHSQEPQVLYEEQILKINADSFDEAYQKSDKFVESYKDKYTNINGDNVEISLYKQVDCFKCYEDDGDIEEIYSGFLKLDNNALKSITTPCEADDLFILRHEWLYFTGVSIRLVKTKSTPTGVLSIFWKIALT